VDGTSDSIEREPNGEIIIRFSGTPEQASRLVKATKAWGVIFRASSGISIEFGNDSFKEEHDPYIAVSELMEYAAESSEFNTVGARVTTRLSRYVRSNPDILDGTPASTERNGRPYFHEDLLRSVSYSASLGEISNLGKKSAALIDAFLEHHDRSQLGIE
jgi:hypothetical protein